MAGNLAHTLRLMLVTDDALVAGRDLVPLCQAAVRGGVTCVQLRLKTPGSRDLVQLARSLREALAVPVLVNDRVDVALAAGAAGVHLGPDDVPVALARRIARPGFLIGASVGAAAEQANGMEADYWGVGPFRLTDTKDDAGAALGADGLARMVAAAGGKPCVAIGGIRPEDAAAAVRSGAAGVAVVSGLLGATDIEAAARSYAAALGLAG